jgi:glycosyltransferase involved in cell wall biosynthesis
MAAGTPVVATAVSGIPEIIEDGVSGLLAPPGEVEAMARGVLEVLRDRNRARALARAARRTVREHHGLERMIDAIEERFMIESRRAAGRRR